RYLIEQGYQNELKLAINAWHLKNTDTSTPPQQITAGQNRVNNYSDEDLLGEISSDNGKVRYPSFWAAEISKSEDEARRIPNEIRELFKAISTTLNPPKPTTDESGTI
ncbi:hypothetical protein RZS08_45810, partial [Arthrospira platensis SPKY1]|nr:hypothetical protein [Arthrospira platensis SPKY1]